PVYRNTSFSLYDTTLRDSPPLSLHDALPIYQYLKQPYTPDDTEKNVFILHKQRKDKNDCYAKANDHQERRQSFAIKDEYENTEKDRKSTRLNSSHVKISYAVFCLKKKNDKQK